MIPKLIIGANSKSASKSKDDLIREKVEELQKKAEDLKKELDDLKKLI